MTTALIIGSNGFIGTWLVKELLSRDWTVFSVDPSMIGLGALDFIGDCHSHVRDGKWHHYFAEWAEFLVDHDLPEVDVVIPLQGQLGSVDSIERPKESLRTSVVTNLSILQTLNKYGMKPLIVFVSSDLCYAPQPNCLYTLHKLTVEGYLRIFNKVHGIPYVILRMGTGFGPFQKRDSVVNFYIRRAMEDKELPVYGDGENRQAFVYIEDAVRCIRMACEGGFCLNKMYPLVGYNLAIKDIAETVARCIGRGTVKHVEWPALAKAVSVGDLPIDEIGLLSWKPRVTFEQGILRTADWIKCHIGGLHDR